MGRGVGLEQGDDRANLPRSKCFFEYKNRKKDSLYGIVIFLRGAVLIRTGIEVMVGGGGLLGVPGRAEAVGLVHLDYC